MRWLAYFILAYVLLGLQLGLDGHAQYHGTMANLVLLAVVFISLNAPRDEALLGSFLLGAMQDLVTLQPMGLYAFSYGLVAMVIARSLAQLAEREHPLTHFIFALLAGILTGIILLIHGWVHPLSPGVRLSVKSVGISVLYTSVLALIVLGILQRMQWAFAFEAPRRKMRL